MNRGTGKPDRDPKALSWICGPNLFHEGTINFCSAETINYAWGCRARPTDSGSGRSKDIQHETWRLGLRPRGGQDGRSTIIALWHPRGLGTSSLMQLQSGRGNASMSSFELRLRPGGDQDTRIRKHFSLACWAGKRKRDPRKLGSSVGTDLVQQRIIEFRLSSLF